LFPLPATDNSNGTEVKIVRVVVRYFVRDVSVKLLEFTSLPGETAAILGKHNCILQVRYEPPFV